jgi:hypothetical protein
LGVLLQQVEAIFLSRVHSVLKKKSVQNTGKIRT